MKLVLTLGIASIGLFHFVYNEECCLQKKIGGYVYHFLNIDDSDTSSFNCLSSCVYTRDGEPNSKYCFRAGGDLIPVCEDMKYLRVRKNLTTLSKEELHDLIYALIEAKKFGTNSGPPISGQADNNSSDFNSSYYAATSFHGYPGLCGGPNNQTDTDDGGCCIHGYSTFLPWHRLFMLQLEDSLRANPKFKHVTLPYWDWTQIFYELPHLLRNPTIPDPTNSSIILQNPFYHSWIPRKNFTKRSPYALTNYTNHHCLETKNDCYNITQNWTDHSSALMDLTLTALEETEYEGFETQIEFPHNMVHNQLGFTPDTKACYLNDSCYPYTMQNTYYSSFDPLFLIFHTMVDFQWAVFQALQDHRGIPYADDCHPGFDGELRPFNTELNSNDATKSFSRGKDTIEYQSSFAYTYDQLTLNGMNISKLNTFLDKRNDLDRLFAGFSLPNIHIKGIIFQIVCPDSTCINPSKNFTISKVHKKFDAPPGVYTDSRLLYYEVTKDLPRMGLHANQNIRFQIISSSIPENVTFAPVSIFRKAANKKAGMEKDQITVYWQNQRMDYNYAPFFKVRQNRNSSLRFILPNGSQAVYQYKDRQAFKTCNETERTLENQEIEIQRNKEYFFQNPLLACEDANKIEVDRTNTCNWGNLFREENGNATIGWQLDMSKYSEGICMEKGSFLTFYWRRDYHNVKKLNNKSEFDKCYVDWDPRPNSGNIPGYGAPYNLTYPQTSEGFQEDVYYLACPVGNGAHCYQGMKLKIDVKIQC